MSRFYPALSDTRTCMKCNSACALFGQIDEETSWFGWCTLCNKTWHNRRAESMLLAVNWEFKRRSLAALTGNNATALKTFTFLQTNIDCVKHSIQLRHHLNIQVLVWLCCPLAWFYESDSEAEAERIQHPVLRTLQETFILSRTFKTMCFPCPISDRSWTLLHAVCSYLRWPWTAHICDSNPRREHAWHLFRWAHTTTHGYEMKQQKNGFLSEIHLQNGNATSSTTNKDNKFIGGSLANAGFLNQ